MCKVMEDMRKETAVLTAIDVYRDMQLAEDQILQKIMVKFGLTKTEAGAYMDQSKESA